MQSMRILRATHLGMCFGVRDAIDLALERGAAAPLTILGDLVHNAAVLQRLGERGIAVAHDPSDVTTTTVMVSAHGASKRAIARTQALGLDVVEATCPLVKTAHQAVRALLRDGYHPVIVGQRNHVEVRGVTEDLDAFDVVLDDADVDALVERPRLGVVSQTTQPIDRVRRVVAMIRAKFPRSEVRFIDTVCLPTKQRQNAAVELAAQSDVVVVVGGAGSNNTRELVKTCGAHCARVHHVQTEADLQAEWLLGADTIGLTAGTSTPDDIIDRVETRILELSRTAQLSVASGNDHAGKSTHDVEGQARTRIEGRRALPERQPA
jgi:4-hydroxy-3-methylbut-2-en-1-yl diphosphate reductase